MAGHQRSEFFLSLVDRARGQQRSDAKEQQVLLTREGDKASVDRFQRGSRLAPEERLDPAIEVFVGVGCNEQPFEVAERVVAPIDAQVDKAPRPGIARFGCDDDDAVDMTPRASPPAA